MGPPIVFLASVVSLLVYVIVARRATRTRDRNRLPQDYFLARHAVAGEEFASAQVAYQLQMSTV